MVAHSTRNKTSSSGYARVGSMRGSLSVLKRLTIDSSDSGSPMVASAFGLRLAISLTRSPIPYLRKLTRYVIEIPGDLDAIALGAEPAKPCVDLVKPLLHRVCPYAQRDRRSTCERTRESEADRPARQAQRQAGRRSSGLIA